MSSTNTATTTVGFIGLGAMGFGMACNLLTKPQYHVTAYDIWAPSADKFAARGGHVGKSPRDVAAKSDFLVCMTTNSQQIDQVLFSEQTGALKALPASAIILICSTVSPTYHQTLMSRIERVGRLDVSAVDCPVSGGTKRAAEGTLTIFASGPSSALQRSDSLLRDISEKLYVIPGLQGAASKVKMINQLLVGAQIAVAAEAMSLAAKAGLNTREVYEHIIKSNGNSWAFENRVPHMLDGDWTPHSALDIFVKDMDIVMSTARTVGFSLPLASMVEQLYISGSSQGLGKEDDAGLVRIFLPGTPNLVNHVSSESTNTSATVSIRLIDDLLCGVHFVAAAEVMAFASHLGLDRQSVYEILRNAAGWSWVFENMMSQALNLDWTMLPEPATFVNNLGSVLYEAKCLRSFAPLSSISHNVYLSRLYSRPSTTQLDDRAP